MSNVTEIGVVVDTSSVPKATDSLKQLAAQGPAVERSLNQAEKGLGSVNAGGKAAGQALDQLKPKLDQVGVSAKQTAAALRGVPAQFTDIVTALQGGQNPMTVFLQQGGQLKDMFGGVAPAAKALGGYVLGLVNPLTVTAGLFGALAVAAYQGSQEFTSFQNAISKTNGYLGMTATEMQLLAASTASMANVTKGAAAAAMTELANTGRVAAADLSKLTAAAVNLEKYGGQAVDETVKIVTKLSQDPTKAAMALNEQLHFLTQTQVEQMLELERVGDKAGAASIAMSAYADNANRIAAEVKGNLGLIETAWDTLKNSAKGAWDAMMNIGRGNSDDLMVKLKQGLGDAASFTKGLLGFGGSSAPESTADVLKRVQAMQGEVKASQDKAKAEAEARRIQDEGTQATVRLAAQAEAAMDKQAKKQKELTQLQKDYTAARLAAEKNGTLDKTQFTPEWLKKQQDAIADKYKERTPRNREAEKAEREHQQTLTEIMREGLSAQKAIEAGVVDVYRERMSALKQYRQADLISEQDYQAGAMAAREEYVRSMQESIQKEMLIVSERLRQSKDPSDQVNLRRQLNELVAKHAEVEARVNKEISDESRAQQIADLQAVRSILLDLSPWDAYIEKVRKLNEAKSKGLPEWAYREAMDKEFKAYQAKEIAKRRESDFTFNMQMTAVESLVSATDGLFDAMRDGWKGVGKWAEQTILNISKQLLQMQLQMALMGSNKGANGGFGNGLIGAAVDFFGGMFGAGSNAGAASGTLTFGGAGTTTVGLATGGNASAGNMYEVGEKGHELFKSGGRTYLIPGNDGYVTPNSRMGGGGTGAPIVNVFNQSGQQVEATSKSRKGDQGEDIIDIVLKRVAKSVQSGGEVADAIQGTYGLQRQGA